MTLRYLIYLVLFGLSCSSPPEQSANLQAADESEVPLSQSQSEVRSEHKKPVEEGAQTTTLETDDHFSTAQAAQNPRIKFRKHTFDFGEIFHAEKVTHQFEFVNEGDRDLEIKNAKASCGCTTPSYPFLPIAPGEKGFIGVTYNSVGKQGYQRATIRVRTNDPTQEEVILKLKGTVKVKPKEEYEAEQAAKKKESES